MFADQQHAAALLGLALENARLYEDARKLAETLECLGVTEGRRGGDALLRQDLPDDAGDVGLSLRAGAPGCPKRCGSRNGCCRPSSTPLASSGPPPHRSRCAPAGKNLFPSYLHGGHETPLRNETDRRTSFGHYLPKSFRIER